MTFLLWAAAAAAAVFWALRLFAAGAAVPAHAKPVSALTLAPALQAVDLSRMLGAEPVAVAPVAQQAVVADPRFQLLGVVAPRHGASTHQAVALIAVDGKPARAYRVGTAVSGDTVLRAVHAKGADLGPRQGPVLVQLQVPSNPGARAPAAAGGVALPPPPVAAPPRPQFGVTPGALAPQAPAPAMPPPASNRPPRSFQAQQMPAPDSAALPNLMPPAESDVAGETQGRRLPGGANATR